MRRTVIAGNSGTHKITCKNRVKPNAAHLLARYASLLHTALGQSDIRPAGKPIIGIIHALSVAHNVYLHSNVSRPIYRVIKPQ